jgi:general secretion pathway protein L
LIQARQLYSTWIENTAQTLLPVIDRFQKARKIRLIENDDESMTLHCDEGSRVSLLAEHNLPGLDSGLGDLGPEWQAALANSRIEIILRSDRFLVQPLELPKQASDFLEGIVRSQLDRLTPWHAGNAAFGWTSPVDVLPERMKLNVVATSNSITTPYIELATRLGAKTVAIATRTTDASGAPELIEVFRNRAGEASEFGRTCRVLSNVLLAALAAATLSVIASSFIDAGMQREQAQLSREIADRRLRLSKAGYGSAHLALARRKRETPASVIVLDELSRILPDDTVASEIRIERGRLQIKGSTRDAASLIAILEKSPHFANANFFAPTTRPLNDPLQHFNIEVQLKPYFEVGL